VRIYLLLCQLVKYVRWHDLVPHQVERFSVYKAISNPLTLPSMALLPPSKLESTHSRLVGGEALGE